MPCSSLGHRRLSVLASLFGLLLFAPLAAFAGADFQARTAIVLEPTFFDTPLEWSITNSGSVYFEAVRMSGGLLGLHITGGPGGFTPIFESGDAAPELAGLTMHGPSGEWVATDSGYAFQVGLQGAGVTSANNIALYAGTLSSGPRLVFREGDEIPSMPGTFYSFGAANIRVNGAGHTFFQVDLSPSGTALMVDSGAPGDPVVVATGSPTALLNPVIRSGGSVGYIHSDGSFGVWSGAPSSPTRLVGVGDGASGTSDTFAEFEALSVTSTSRLALLGTLTASGDDVVYSDYGPVASQRLVHRSTQTLWRMTANSTGHVAFREGFGAGSKFYAEQPGLTVVAEVGSQAPGLAAGVDYFDFDGFPVINDFRQVAFKAQLSGAGVGPANDQSLWISDEVLGTQIVAREGSTIQIAPADTRTIESIVASLSSIHGASLQDGTQKNFNRAGELVFLAHFTDGISALLVTPRLTVEEVFADGFESGDATAWSSTSP